MPTRVVNIDLGEAYDVYVGRGGKGMDGTFGNPFRRGVLDGLDGPGAVLSKYRGWFLRRVETDPEFREKVLGLRGKTLGCFCAPVGGVTGGDRLICHGQIIAAWVDAQESA